MRSPADRAVSTFRLLRDGTTVASLLAVCVAQVTVVLPAVLTGLFQYHLGTTSA